MGLEYLETGIITGVKGPVVEMNGLERCLYGQIIEFGYETIGMICGFDDKSVQALILKETVPISPGNKVFARLKPFNVPVGDKFIGRVVNALGEPCDGQGPIEADDYCNIFQDAPTVMDRQPVNAPMETGVLLVDALIPVGRGQRELVLGDKMTGKTTICTDAIINQKGKDVICIYCCIGKSNTQLGRVISLFKDKGCFEYTSIVSATAAAYSGQQYIVPYVAATLADYFMYSKRHVLLVFDDLTKHAWAYRQVSLLLGRPPGRGAYPGDVFYLHSRLVERAAKLNNELGAGSQTHLPIIETLENDLTAYIPTNLVSMTDGQIFVSSILFNEGFKPAVNIGLSVSRVGSKAQWPIIKKLSGAIRLDYIQYMELLRVTKLQSSVSKEVKRRLKKGEILVSFITQYRDVPMPLPLEAFLLYAYQHDLVLDLSFEDIARYKAEVYSYVEEKHPELIELINKEKKLTEEVEEMIERILPEYVHSFPSYMAFLQQVEEEKKRKEEEKRLIEKEKAERKAEREAAKAGKK
ncbi:MAG: F0F1 ATP synthase subunit alpha [Candidatus Omnitrophica bacterium]|nr:F0F1 ATP synthase subunit alpha [Candidatus Omnitrophota bacterium]